MKKSMKSKLERLLDISVVSRYTLSMEDITMKINTRHCAELTWGKGGTHPYRTNRKGAYYYSCSGHGGYVVLADALSEEEKAKINPYAEPVNVPTLELNGKVYGTYYGNIPQDYTGRGSKRRFKSAPGAEWVDNLVYFFEEDCDWAILEKFTDIRRDGRGEGHEEVIEKSMAYIHNLYPELNRA